MPPRRNIKIDGKLYIFVADDALKGKLTKYVSNLRKAGYLVRVAKITYDKRDLPPDVLAAYMKDFPRGRWGVWVRKRSEK